MTEHYEGPRHSMHCKPGACVNTCEIYLIGGPPQVEHPDLDDPAVRDAILSAAADHIEEGQRVMAELHPDDLPDPRAHVTAAIELQGVATAIWGFSAAPPMVGDPLVDGAVTRADEDDQPILDDVYVFSAAITRGPTPFGIVVQLGRDGEQPLRTMWLDGSQLLNILVSAGVAHITGEGLTWNGPGPDPTGPVTIPDTVPDDLEGGTS